MAPLLHHLIPELPSMYDHTFKTVIIEPHPLLRLGLEAIVKRTLKLELKGSWRNIDHFSQSSPEWTPQIILLGNFDPQEHMGANINLLKERFPSANIALCRNETNRTNLETLLQAGACGILDPETIESGFSEAMERISLGLSYISPRIKEGIIETTFREPKSLKSRPKGALSPRETEVLAYVASGKSTRKIAIDMGISFKTVQTLVRRIKIKKGLKTFSELVTYARQSRENHPTKTPA